MASLSERILFEEKQYLGHNKTSTIIRLTIATFCFVAYYWSENPKPISIGAINIGWYPAYNIPNSGKIFFVLGILVLILSAFLINVQHLHTRVYHNSIIIDGFWTSRRVKIDLRNIHTVKKLRYKKNTLRRPVYNLHVKGKIKFFTTGYDFLELKDTDGIVYRLGTQRPNELFRIINTQINMYL